MKEKMNKLEDFTKNPFAVPDNFFERFNEEIMTKLPPKETKKVKLNIKKHVLPWLAAAAVMSGVIFTMKDSVFSSPKADVENESVTQPNFASSEDHDFYLYLQDDATNKEITTGNLENN